MSDDSHIEESSEQEDLFAHLAPPEVKPVQTKTINFLLKQKLDKQLQAKFNPPVRRGKKRQANLADRSRSRDQMKSSRDHQDNCCIKFQQGRAPSKDVIVVSDQEEENKCDKEEWMINRPWQGYASDHMNWKERRRLDRMMARGIRHFREGKPYDQLSFKVFNTIQSYFK